MFAFAVWDAQEKRLFAARDLFGEKPLYFATTPDGGLLLASEIRALLASGKVAPELDLQLVDAFLAFGYVPLDRTIYKNVQTLPPGHFLDWDGRILRVERYWLPRFAPHAIGLDEVVERLRELLSRLYDDRWSRTCRWART